MLPVGFSVPQLTASFNFYICFLVFGRFKKKRPKIRFEMDLGGSIKAQRISSADEDNNSCSSTNSIRRSESCNSANNNNNQNGASPQLSNHLPSSSPPLTSCVTPTLMRSTPSPNISGMSSNSSHPVSNNAAGVNGNKIISRNVNGTCM